MRIIPVRAGERYTRVVGDAGCVVGDIATEDGIEVWGNGFVSLKELTGILARAKVGRGKRK